MRLWLLCDLFVRISSNALLTAKYGQERHAFRVSKSVARDIFPELQTTQTRARLAHRERERERERDKRQIKRVRKSKQTLAHERRCVKRRRQYGE